MTKTNGIAAAPANGSSANGERTANVLRAWRTTTSGVVFAGVAANAATQFAIQAYMSYRFAKDVWAIPRPLCVAIIVALDLFAVMFMVFTYLLRTAKWYVQLYVWIVFAAGVGAQLFAAELYGSHAEWTQPVRLFAALPALFLAASLHGLIIWRNHTAKVLVVEKAPAPAPAPTRRHIATPAEQDTSRAPVTERPARVEPKPQAKPQPSKPSRPSSSGNPNRTEAVRRVAAGEDTKAVAASLGVSRRAVQLWVKSTPQQAEPQLRIVQTDPQPVNGYSFPVDSEVN